LKASAIAPEQSEAQPPPTFANWAAWNGYMSSVPAPHAGCFEAKYPSTVWQASKCGTAPLQPLQPSRASPSTVGNGNDEVAQAPSGKLIGSSVGSFQSVTGLASETDSKYGANEFGLQVNSQTFTTSTTYTSGKSATGWEQFVFINDPSGEYGTQIYIQYWLLGYHSAYGSCSSTGPPNGSSWMQSGSSCYANSPSTSVPTQTASNLANLIQKGYANFASSNDEVVFCISGGSCYAVAITDQVVDLYEYWQDAEFNVFGLGDGSQANFNSGTTITVLNAVKDQSGNVIVPSCVNQGYTGETNNLNLGSCSSNSNGQIVFTESNALVTRTLTTVASGSGLVSPNCPTGCSEAVGSSISVTATSSSGWAFSSWVVTGAACSGGSSSKPCTFSMPNNDVTVSATFIQREQISVSTDKTSYEQGQSIQYTASGFIPGDAVLSCITTSDVAYSGVCIGQGNADSNGNSVGTMLVGTNIPVGPQAFWVADTSKNPPVHSNLLQLTITSGSTTVTMTVSYSVVGGGSPAAPVFLYVLNSVSNSLTLTKAAKTMSVDAGSTWSVTPNPLGGSGSSQQWYSTQELTGTASATTIQFVFQHQYYLTMLVNGPGSVTPSSGWYNKGQTVTITATANAGHEFTSWTGTGTGSYKGKSASHTITMKSTITETANFT